MFYVSLFLLIRFNPFSNFKFTELDKKIAFTGGLFIISTTILNKSVLDYVTQVKNLLQSIERPQQRKVKQSKTERGEGRKSLPPKVSRANLKNI